MHTASILVVEAVLVALSSRLRLPGREADNTYARSKVKIKCTLVQALRLYTGRTAHRGSRGIALLFHEHGTRRG